MKITGEQVKDVRTLLGWPRSKLGGKVGVGAGDIKLFEAGVSVPSKLVLSAIARVLKESGVEFRKSGAAELKLAKPSLTELGATSMNVTLSEAIEIYARASISWFGEKAEEKTAQRAGTLAAMGDHQGAEVYNKVKAEIFRIQPHRKRRQTFASTIR